MPKFSFKSGLIATAIGVTLAFIVWPLIYNHFGEGAQLTKQAVVSSADLRRDCGEVNNFFIIPWQLSLNDSDTSGELQIGYWFSCENDFSNVSAKFHHNGGGWIADKIEAHTSKHYYDLVGSK